MSLYEQVGGEAAVDQLVDVFYGHLLKDESVAPFFVNTDMTKQRRMQKSFLNHVLGGKEYKGRSMRAAHAKLNLKDEHFDAVAACLKLSMEELGLTPDQVSQILAIAETTRNDVLGK